jgi:hypothetical protein
MGLLVGKSCQDFALYRSGEEKERDEAFSSLVGHGITDNVLDVSPSSKLFGDVSHRKPLDGATFPYWMNQPVLFIDRMHRQALLFNALTDH